jgi:hypothetical protein
VRTRVATADWPECRVWRASGWCVAPMTSSAPPIGAGTQRAKPRANGHRRRTPSGHGQPGSPQVEGTSGDAQRHLATGDARLTSEGSLVRNQLCPPRSERCGLASGPGPMGKQVCLVGWATARHTARRSNQALERRLWTVSAPRAGQYCPLAPYATVAGGPYTYAFGPTEAVRHRLQHLSTKEEALQSGLAAARASLATALPGATPDASVPVGPAATRSMALTA